MNKVSRAGPSGSHAGGTPGPASRFVEKIRVPARLSQPNLDPRDGSFQLLPRLGGEQRPESLLELLNSRRAFIPFILAGDSSVLLLAQTNIDWVAVSPNVDRNLILPPGMEVNRGQRAELRFVDERRVEAMIEWYGEREDERLSDFLNMCDLFVASRTGFGTLIWNKQRIREARILPAVARQAGDGLRRPAA